MPIDVHMFIPGAEEGIQGKVRRGSEKEKRKGRKERRNGKKGKRGRIREKKALARNATERVRKMRK